MAWPGFHRLWQRLQRGLQDVTAWLRGGAPAAASDGLCISPSGSRRYRLYRPGWRHFGARPLVVMLHGCRQDPDDFAAGTRMHARGAGRGCFVVYPWQERQANRLGCWNWFLAMHQGREQGEPAILAHMTREIIARHRVDPDRVYVAGLSAGGAMAAILATTHPDLFAAVGIHSGLPHGAASNLSAALVAMKRGARRRRGPGTGRTLPTIVFHGDQDATVHPDNGKELIARLRPGGPATTALVAQTIRGVVAGGHAYTRTVHHGPGGRSDAEHWVVHGSGHAWSGGDPAGSFTDPLGPDASREMWRFFRQHRRSLP
jgi:poly(hydroxyalkanoate) depolymerase family esterase